VARAFAVVGLNTARNFERSVYRVELAEPVLSDPFFLSDNATGLFFASHWGRGIEVVDRELTMGDEEARAVLSKLLWPDGTTPTFDDEGFATVPPKWANDLRYDDDEMRSRLRKENYMYPHPLIVSKILSRYFPL
jgi:hypothetical protein